MIAALLEPLRFGFMQRGMLAVVVVACVCAVVGSYVVLRNLAFLGDAIGHAVFPGSVIALLTGGNLLLGAATTGIVFALLISLLGRHRLVKEDSAIGILFVGAFALGLLLLSTSGSAAQGLSDLLFGSVLGVQLQDLWGTLALGTTVLLAVAFCYKELLITVFDPSLAQALGLPVRRYELLLYLLLALAVIVALPIIGNVLVVALLVVPPATARLLTKRLPAMMLLGALFGSLCSVVGLYLSYYGDLAPGGTIVLLAVSCFFVAFLFAPDGLLRRSLARRRLVREAERG